MVGAIMRHQPFESKLNEMMTNDDDDDDTGLPGPFFFAVAF
jgi:hypothetical protein